MLRSSLVKYYFDKKYTSINCNIPLPVAQKYIKKYGLPVGALIRKVCRVAMRTSHEHSGVMSVETGPKNAVCGDPWLLLATVVALAVSLVDQDILDRVWIIGRRAKIAEQTNLSYSRASNHSIVTFSFKILLMSFLVYDPSTS